MALLPGQILNERYTIVRPIQSGGMGSVYEAQDAKLADSACAVKEVLDSALTGPDADYLRSRFKEEMRTLAGLEHPAIPRVRDFLQLGSSSYLVMELVVGESLLDELATNAPTPEIVVADMLSLLDTLHYLHERGLLHRDIKPANLLRDRRTRAVKLVDFGLARAVGGEQHTIVGTVGYCAPEQLMGKAEPRSDLFSVGVTMAHLITGEGPQGMLLYEPLQLNFGTRYQGLAEIITRATDPCLENRYPTALAMRKALLEWQSSQTAVTVVTPAPARRRRRPLALLLGLGALKAVVLAGLWAFRPAVGLPGVSAPVSAGKDASGPKGQTAGSGSRASSATQSSLASRGATANQRPTSVTGRKTTASTVEGTKTADAPPSATRAKTVDVRPASASGGKTSASPTWPGRTVPMPEVQVSRPVRALAAPVARTAPAVAASTPVCRPALSANPPLRRRWRRQ